MSEILPGDSKRTFSSALDQVGDRVKELFGGDDHEPLDTAGSVDLQRYAGLWYELARLPMRFQADVTVSTAEYTLRSDGKVGVLNTAYRGSETEATIEGTAEVAEGAEETNDRLIVTFGGLLRFIPKSDEGNYWIVRVADDYSMALVGVPDRGAMWLLSRNPQAWGSGQAQDFVATAKDQGFATDKLLVADWNTRTTHPISEDRAAPSDNA